MKTLLGGTRSFLTLSRLMPGGNDTSERTVSPSARTVVQPRHLRTIWISDTHLGTPGCQADYLIDFLRAHRAQTVYLVGDIIDGWQLRKDWYWSATQHEVLRWLLDQAGGSTRVIFVPGNHDEFARDFIGMRVGGIEIRADVIHRTANGRRLLVTHGDQFDGIVRHARWLAHLGDSLYTLILRLNHGFNRIRRRFGLRYWSLSQYLKHQVKNAVSFISDYESALVAEARSKGVDGVICGHIHKAEVRYVDGLLYGNCGDWVESLTALAETADGQIELIVWDRIGAAPVTASPAEGPPTDRQTRARAAAQALVR